MFGENLRKLRLSYGYSQEELGAKLIVNGKPVSGKTIWSWETGRTEPSMGAVQQLADLFKVSTDALIKDGDNTSYVYPNFKTAQEAIKFILSVPLVAQYGGYDLDQMTDEELIDFANRVAQMIQIMHRND